ncbi:MAG: hypothetical protein HYW03_19540 [Deltaproteobacteria bacterium]|nr:hypothetical protein [Deltaproteobacteria bacterium]
MFQTISRPAALFGVGIASWSALWRRLWQALSRRSATRGALEHLGGVRKGEIKKKPTRCEGLPLTESPVR